MHQEIDDEISWSQKREKKGELGASGVYQIVQNVAQWCTFSQAGPPNALAAKELGISGSYVVARRPNAGPWDRILTSRFVALTKLQRAYTVALSEQS
jgi:hypothetical protein